METIDILKKLIKDDVIEPLEQDSYTERYFCTLTEPKELYKLKIDSLPEKTLVIKCDSFPEASRFFKGDCGECKRADYILISDDQNTIMIIELKASNKSAQPKDIKNQLRGAKCVLDYCAASIADSFIGEKGIFEKFDYRYYIYRSIAKSNSYSLKKKKSAEKNDTPENARAITGKSITYRKLLSNE